MAVFNGEAEGDWVSPQKALRAAIRRNAGIRLRHGDSHHSLACRLLNKPRERAAVGRIFDADEAQPRLSCQTNSVVCRLYQRAVSHSIIRVQNSDRRRNLFDAECCFWIEPACVQAGTIVLYANNAVGVNAGNIGMNQNVGYLLRRLRVKTRLGEFIKRQRFQFIFFD